MGPARVRVGAQRSRLEAASTEHRNAPRLSPCRLQQAFILNLSQHWFPIRRFGGQKWYNLNRCGFQRDPSSCARSVADGPACPLSFNEQPQAVSDLYLGMTLNQAETEGYSVFVLRPSEPAHASSSSSRREPSILETARADRMAEQLSVSGVSTEAQAFATKAAANGVDWASYGNFDDEDAELQAALAASVASASGTPITSTPPSRPISSLPSRPPSARQVSLEPDDPVAASRARAQAQLERFGRDQAAALRGEDAEMGFGSFGVRSRSTRAGQSSAAGNPSASTSGASSRDEAAHSVRRRRQADPEPVLLDESDDEGVGPTATIGLPFTQRRPSAEDRPPVAASHTDEDEEMMRRAIAESLREQEACDSLAASSGARTAMDAEDDGADEDGEDLGGEIEVDYRDDDYLARPPSLPAYLDSHADLSAFGTYDRVYDEEDAELQRAIKASMQGIPDDYSAPALALPVPQPSPFIRRPSPPPLQTTPAAKPDRKGDAVDADDDDDDPDDDGAEAPALMPEQIRALRLARFG